MKILGHANVVTKLSIPTPNYKLYEMKNDT